MLSRCSIAILGALLLACVGCGKEAQGEPVAMKLRAQTEQLRKGDRGVPQDIAQGSGIGRQPDVCLFR